MVLHNPYPSPCLGWRGFNLAVTLTGSLSTNLGQHVLPNMARQNPSPHACFIARSVCEPGQVAGEERGLHRVSGGGAPSSPRWGFSQGTDLPTVGEPGRGNILFRPTVHSIASNHHRSHARGGNRNTYPQNAEENLWAEPLEDTSQTRPPLGVRIHLANPKTKRTHLPDQDTSPRPCERYRPGFNHRRLVWHRASVPGQYLTVAAETDRPLQTSRPQMTAGIADRFGGGGGVRDVTGGAPPSRGARYTGTGVSVRTQFVIIVESNMFRVKHSYTGCAESPGAFLVCLPARAVIGGQSADDFRRDPRQPGQPGRVQI